MDENTVDNIYSDQNSINKFETIGIMYLLDAKDLANMC